MKDETLENRELPFFNLYPACKKGAAVTIHLPEGETLPGEITGPTTISSECLEDAFHDGTIWMVKTRHVRKAIPAKWCRPQLKVTITIAQ